MQSKDRIRVQHILDEAGVYNRGRSFRTCIGKARSARTSPITVQIVCYPLTR